MARGNRRNRRHALGMPSVEPQGALAALVQTLSNKWGVPRDARSVSVHLKRKVSSRIETALKALSEQHER